MGFTIFKLSSAHKNTDRAVISTKRFLAASKRVITGANWQLDKFWSPKIFAFVVALKKCMFWTSLCIAELKHRPRGLLYVSSTIFRFHFNDLPFGEKIYSALNANIESHLPLISLKFQNLLFSHNSLGDASHVLSDTSRHFVRTRLQPVLHSSHQSL